MPCEYTRIRFEEAEREKKREGERKKSIERKKKALVMALDVLGYEVSVNNVGGKTYLEATKGGY